MSSSSHDKMFNSIEQWQRSGVSQKAWCTENNIPYSVFHYWYRRFRNLHPENEQVVADRFVQIKVPDHLSGIPWCELVLTNGQKFVFHQPLAAEFIRSILA
jgi:hypothetical protein